MAEIKAKVIGLSDMSQNIAAVIKSLSPPIMADVMLTGAKVGAQYVKEHIDRQGLVLSGAMRESVDAVKINQYAAAVRVAKIYAMIHEFGGETHPTVTPRARRFFWYRYKETGDPMWKAMALSKKDKFTVKIPARPYFRPGIEEAKPAMIAEIGYHALANIKAAL